MEFTVMTFNVEEYFHDFDTNMFLTQMAEKFKQAVISSDDARDWLARLEQHVFEKIALIRAIIEKYFPDVLCVEEHSSGIDHNLLTSWGLSLLVSEEYLSHDRIISALLPEGYAFCLYRTGETIAKYSELANMVAWRTAKFERRDANAEQGMLITPPRKPIPGGRGFYTPRSVACAELRTVCGNSSFIVCATHLLGGRFEDSCWASDREAGVNERVNQIVAINGLVSSIWSTENCLSIIAGDFNVMRKGFLEGAFARVSKEYVIGKTMVYSRARLEKDFLEQYVPYQVAVHERLEKLGYCAAYGRSDACAEMKTSRHGGCTDWIYSRGIQSRRNERVIFTDPTNKNGASDHNAVICSFTLPMVPKPRFGLGPGLLALPLCRRERAPDDSGATT